MRVRLDKTIKKLRLISITFDFDTVDKMSVEFSDVIQVGNVLSDINSVLQQASAISSTYNYVTDQAKQGSEANVEINKILQNGLDSAYSAVMAGDNQEITMDRHGLLFRKFLDELDDYSKYQMKLINRNIVMTDDGWVSAKLAIGLGMLPDGTYGYGIWADNIIGGDITCTKNLRIIGANGKIIIDGDKISFEDNVIDESAVNGLVDYEKDINDFKDGLSLALGITSTTITKDSIISPKIGGGYLYIAKKNGCSVEIDPLGLKNGNVLRIADKKDNNIMGVDNNGNGTFKGKITSSDAEITGGSITVTGVYDNKNTTTYIGSGYVKVHGNDQGVDRSIELYNGTLWAKDTASNKKLSFQNENFEMDSNGEVVFKINTKAESFSIYSSKETIINSSDGNINFGGDTKGNNPSMWIGNSILFLRLFPACGR